MSLQDRVELFNKFIEFDTALSGEKITKPKKMKQAKADVVGEVKLPELQPQGRIYIKDIKKQAAELKAMKKQLTTANQKKKKERTPEEQTKINERMAKLRAQKKTKKQPVEEAK